MPLSPYGFSALEWAMFTVSLSQKKVSGSEVGIGQRGDSGSTGDFGALIAKHELMERL